jgi:hypothetical protein
MPNNEKVELIETLSCDDAIIKHVTDQIFDGFTTNIYSGSEGFTIEPRTPLELARARVIKHASEVAQKEVERLKRIARNQEEQAKKYEDMYFELLENKKATPFKVPLD